jgi:hypothetical protein
MDKMNICLYIYVYTGDTGDDGYYNLVFSLSQTNSDNQKVSQFTLKPTQYGRGYVLRLLNKSNLEACQPNIDTPELGIIVGLAYRHRILLNTPPFCVSLESNNANKLAKMWQERKGFDCVEVQGDSASGGTTVYWTPNIVLPFAAVTLRSSKCVLCHDFVARNGGYSCKASDFICWDCLEAFVESASQPDAVGKNISDTDELR